MDLQKLIGGLLVVLAGSIAWSAAKIQESTERIAEGTQKLESAAKIFQESEDCVNRCPTYKTGDYGKDGFHAADNSDHEKCVNVCTGEQRQKFKALLK